MPTIKTAITVITNVTAPSDIFPGWGGGAVVGISTYANKNTAKKYANLAAVQADHGDNTNVTKAAASVFAQGAAYVYAVSVQATGTTIAPSDLLTALGELSAVSEVHAVCLAGIGTDQTDLTATLKSWADTADKVFVVTNAPGATISEITEASAALASPRGLYAAYKTADGSAPTEDIAAAVLGTIITSKPGEALMWAPVRVSGLEHFTEGEVVLLEGARVCAVYDVAGDGSQRLSNGLTTSNDADEPAQFIDTTITRMYISGVLRQALAAYRLNTRKAPYTPAGIEYVRSTLVAAMDGLVADDIVMDSYTVEMPAFASIPEEQRRARKLSGITITCAETGNMQEFVIVLNMEAA